MAQLVKNPPAMRETWVRSLGWEDPLEKGKATHSSILAIVLGVANSLTQLSDFHFHTHIILFFKIFFSIVVYHRILNIVFCLILLDLVVYPFYV